MLCAKYEPYRHGSSPRGRGTGASQGQHLGAGRFIPAWAGNSQPQPRGYPPPAVHPRVGGEQSENRNTRLFTHGSSPRGRGTDAAKKAAETMRRFIPAWAGNRARRTADAPNFTVHPRVGGEQKYRVAYSCPRIGSSPRGRGTAFISRVSDIPSRFIPAWAGNSAP